MQTTAISNTAKTQSANSSASKSANDNSGQPFADMLGREMDRTSIAADTTASIPTATRNTTNSAKASGNTNDNDAPAKSTTNVNAQDNAPATASNADQTEDAVAVPAKGKTAIEKQDNDADTVALSAASSELIAMVANMQQSATVKVDAKTDVVADDKTSDSKQDGKQDITDALAENGSKTTVDAAALAAAQSVIAAQAAVPSDSPSAAVVADMLPSTASNTSDSLATGGKSLPTPASITTPVQRGITMAATPAGSDLKTPVETKGKHAASFAAEVDAKAVKEDKQAVVKNDDGDMPTAQQSMQASRSESLTAPRAPAQQAAHAQQQENPAIANIASVAAAMSNQPSTALNQVQNVAAQFVDNLAPRVGTQDWNQALGQKVVWMANGELQSASLTLNPPDLGPLRVVLSVTNNHATANFTAAQPEVRQALESAMPKLREMLGDVGIQLGQANVSTGMPNQQQNAFNTPQQSSRQSSGGNGGVDAVDTQARVTHVQPARGGLGLVDTFA